MGTYALGAFMAEREGRTGGSHVDALIRDMRNAGKLKALPITATDKKTGTLKGADGTELREYGMPGSGRWVPIGELSDGAIMYLGSASHAGHIELKALCVFAGGAWYNIITGLSEPMA